VDIETIHLIMVLFIFVDCCQRFILQVLRLKSSFGNKQFSCFQQKSILLEKLSITASPAALVVDCSASH
jgi:hypothetical protein